MDIIIEKKFIIWLEDMEQKAIQKGMQEGMRITYLFTKNPNLSDEKISKKYRFDLEAIRKVRENLMEFI